MISTVPHWPPSGGRSRAYYRRPCSWWRADRRRRAPVQDCLVPVWSMPSSLHTGWKPIPVCRAARERLKQTHMCTRTVTRTPGGRRRLSDNTAAAQAWDYANLAVVGALAPLAVRCLPRARDGVLAPHHAGLGALRDGDCASGQRGLARPPCSAIVPIAMRMYSTRAGRLYASLLC